MPCISFIVPVYNMERLLPRALRSLRAQTLTDFEAILINDGSKDGSAALCAQAAAEDARFRFIDQPNGGVATARNAGLDAARGEYIFFLDPDDWVEPDAAEVLYHAARNADADCVEFGLYLDSYDENDRLLHTQTSGSTLSGVYRGAPFKEHFDETASSYLVTNKLFRRAFLEQHRLRFSCHQLGEDGLFFVAFYRQNPGCLVVLEKPELYYQFDETEFRQYHYKQGYFDYRRDGFGPVCTTEEALLQALETALQNGMQMPPEYKARTAAFFPLRDTQNCARTYEAICGL